MKANISHNSHHSSLEKALEILKTKIKNRGDLPYVTTNKQLEYLEELNQFPLGQFLIERGGLNGYWTHYVVVDSQGIQTNCPTVDFLLQKAPVTKAMRQRYQIFRDITQKCVKEGVTLASIPCGLMGDLLHLDFTGLKNFKLVGIDYDEESLESAAKLATERHLSQHIELSQKDAWNLGVHEQFDLVTSSGLNIYEPDPQKVIALYRQFFLALKHGGRLVTSFLTPPPSETHPGEWAMDKVSQEAAMLQKIIFGDILATKWQSFCSEQSMTEMVAAAGFTQIEVLFDEAHIFPTITAVKA